jgi:urease accessory protein
VAAEIRFNRRGGRTKNVAVKKVIDVEACSKNGKTWLKKGFAAHPFKLADITEHRSCNTLELMLMNSSPGVLDGDHYEMLISVGEAASLVLKTQSYQRLFTMKSSASQQLEVHVESGGVFTYLPHPVVPHANAHFTSLNKISLSTDSQLTWGEIITCGRKLNGEVFAFTYLKSLTEIYWNRKLVLRDNLVMKPATGKVHSMGKLEGYTHQASLVIINERINRNELVSLVYELLLSEAEICYGVSALTVEGAIVRILGNKAEQLYNLLQSVSVRCAAFCNGKGNFSPPLIKPEEYVG